MNCPDCGAEMKILFISSYCPRCSTDHVKPTGKPDGWVVYSSFWGKHWQEHVLPTEADAEKRKVACGNPSNWFTRPVRFIRRQALTLNNHPDGYNTYGSFRSSDLEVL